MLCRKTEWLCLLVRLVFIDRSFGRRRARRAVAAVVVVLVRVIEGVVGVSALGVVDRGDNAALRRSLANSEKKYRRRRRGRGGRIRVVLTNSMVQAKMKNCTRQIAPTTVLECTLFAWPRAIRPV